jgi:uncharacterized membrane protein SpoIIM required for sporulation
MKVVDLLEARRGQWRELETLCFQLEGNPRKLPASTILRLGTLYRAVCADLAMADAYQLPPNTVNFLHQLVARAHNQIYRSQRWNWKRWKEEIFILVPQRLFNDWYLRLAFILFWGLFIGALLYAKNDRDFTKALIGDEQMDSLKEMYKEPPHGRTTEEGSLMFGFYVHHNAGIGLSCFASGLLFGIGGLFELIYNALVLGGSFGYMASLGGNHRNNFFEFVTAHGPFELTAVVLAAAAGMRMGFALISTRGLTRAEALTRAAREAFPTACTAVLLFIGAAVIEGFISPSSLPYWSKALVAATTSGMLLYYFLILGYARVRTNDQSE